MLAVQRSGRCPVPRGGHRSRWPFRYTPNTGAALRIRALGELAGHNCLLGSADHWTFDLDGQHRAWRVEGNWRANSGLALLDAVRKGLGLAQLPDYYVQGHLRSGALRALLPQHQPPHTAVWALYPQQRHLSPKVRQLVDHLKRGLAQRPEYSTP